MPRRDCTARFLGQAEIDGKTIEREGIPVETAGQAFYIKHLVPTQGFLLQVRPGAYYTLSSDAPQGKELELPRGGELKIVVKAARLDGATGPISLAAASPPPGIVVKPAQIAPA